MDETPSQGFHQVDAHPETPLLLAAMEATAKWEATIALRAFERQQLQLTAGQRLLDVGFGLGDAALALAADLGADGEVVGIDASEAMISAARERVDSAPCAVRFSLGDAMSLPEPDASFDAVRSERTLQWVPDPGVAVAEMHRVLRPGGRVSLIDSDWSTFVMQIGDPEVEGLVHETMRHERPGRPSNVGRRLAELIPDSGFELIGQTTAIHVWDEWDPDTSLGPAGFLPAHLLAHQMVETGQTAQGDAERAVARIASAARGGRFHMELTIHAVAGRA